jgi:hypothetical protein
MTSPKRLTRDEARRVALGVAKLPDLLKAREIWRTVNEIERPNARAATLFEVRRPCRYAANGPLGSAT